MGVYCEVDDVEGATYTEVDVVLDEVVVVSLLLS